MHEVNFDEILDQILAQDSRFHRDAYVFVRDALETTKKQVHKENREGREEKHVTGQELLEGIRLFALKEFGPMTATVFEEWGVRNCRDFGEIVFNMVEIRLLAKTEKDTRDDFQSGYDFNDAFRKPFWPQNKLNAEAKPAVN